MSLIDAVMGKNMAINKLTQNGQVGYIENNSFTFDGNTNGRLVLLDTYVRVSTKPFDLGQVERISLSYATGQKLDFTVGQSVILMQGEPLSAIMDSASPLVFACTKEHFNEQYGSNIPVGVYVAVNAEVFISEVHCKDVVHPIDQKYLPDEEIDLSAYGIDVASLVLSGGGEKEYSLNAEMKQKFVAELREKKPKYALMRMGTAAFRCAITVLADLSMAFFLISVSSDNFITAKIHISTSDNDYGFVRVIAEVS